MLETYVAVSDALARTPQPVFLVQWQDGRRLPRPFYMPGRSTQTPGEYAASLAKLGKLGIVRTN